MDRIRKTARYNGRKYEATGKTELEAMTKLAEKLAAAKRGEEIIHGAMTVDAWYVQWKAAYKDPKGLTQKSLGMYDEKYRGYIKPRIGRMKLRDVKDIHLQKILNGEAGRSASHVKKAAYGYAGDVPPGQTVQADTLRPCGAPGTSGSYPGAPPGPYSPGKEGGAGRSRSA